MYCVYNYTAGNMFIKQGSATYTQCEHFASKIAILNFTAVSKHKYYFTSSACLEMRNQNASADAQFSVQTQLQCSSKNENASEIARLIIAYGKWK